MSRARDRTTIYATAETMGQAAEDLARDWSTERRDRWTIDMDTPLEPGQQPRPVPIRRIDEVTRRSRIRAERDAAAAVGALDDATTRRFELHERLVSAAAPIQEGRSRGVGF